MAVQRSLLSRGIDIRGTSLRRRLDYKKVPRASVRPPVLSAESRAILFRIKERKRIDKNLRSLVKAHTPALPPPPRSRKRNPFIDDVAIESDGDGGDVSSTPSSPDTPDIVEVPCTPKQGFRLWFPTAAPKKPASKPPLPHLRSKPLRFPVPKKSIVKPAKSFVHIHRFGIKSTTTTSINSIVTSSNVDIKPAVTVVPKPLVKPSNCDLCGITVTGPQQLQRHRGTKKCLRRSKNSTSN